MLVQAHVEKFRRMELALDRLDPEADPELWIWTSMNGLTHLMNAALHRLGLTKAVDSFHTQVEGLWAIPDRRTGLLADAMHPPGEGDVMHLGRPPIPSPLPVAIQRAGASLKVIEDLRAPFVRGNQPVPPGSAAGWREAHDRCRSELLALVEPGSP